MAKYIKQILHGGINLLGYNAYNIKRNKAAETKRAETKELDKWHWAKSAGVELVLDIGANTGQFATTISKALPGAEIVSFEPIASCFNQLNVNLRGHPKFRAFQLALLDVSGEVDFNVNEFTPSSSILDLGPLHRELYSFATNTRKSRVKATRLDDLLHEIKINERTLIKLDVQGAEDRVITGGTDAFAKAGAVVTEVSYWELYKGQSLFAEINGSLGALGYCFAGLMDQITRPEDSLPIYGDALFIKPALACRLNLSKQECLIKSLAGGMAK